MLVLFAFLASFTLLGFGSLAAILDIDFRPPAGERYVTRGPNGASILPGGRVIQPLGVQLPTGPGPFGMVVNANGKLIVTANLGPQQSSVTVLRQDRSAGWAVQNFHARQSAGEQHDAPSLSGGLALANSKQVWISEGESGSVHLEDLESGSIRETLSLNNSAKNSFSGDLAFDAARNRLYVVDQAHFRVVVFDTRSELRIAEVPTGLLPYAISLSPDGQRAWVSNIGLFRYHVIPGADVKRSLQTGLPFPAFGFPSQDAADGAVAANGEGRTVKIPGLGDPGSREANAVCALDMSLPESPKVLGFVKTGVAFGPESAGGSGPSGILATANAVYVSNSHDDTIDVIDPIALTVRSSIPLRIPGLESVRGILPLGLALDERNGRLLVAEAGINAVGVVDLKQNKLIAHLPAGWYPASVAVREGQVIVSNVKGRGTGPSSTVIQPDYLEFGDVFRRGSVSVFPMPSDDEFAKRTQLVMAANGFLPVRQEPAKSLPIRYVVVIVKENRTFDEVFGDLTVQGDTKPGNTSVQGNKIEAMSKLARFGAHGYADGAKLRFSLQNLNVTPNHHALAERFSISDNFYADSDVSVDGHHWVVGAYPDAWTESSLLSAYAGQKSFRLDDTAPGRLLFAESNSSVHPEEQEQAGSLWHHLEKSGVSFRNFGEGFELAGNQEGEGEKPTGARFLTNVPMPDALFRNTSRSYPGFNMNIPDQYRAAQFIGEIDRMYAKTGQDLPRLLFLHLPNDHIDNARPKDGYPYKASFVADNDVALGKIVDYLSHSVWWRQMAIFVTEDDAQGGKDHVDAHRTVLLGIGPYFKRHYVSHVNASFPSILKTVFHLLGMPPLNLFDASAADLTSLLTDSPDFEPYSWVTTDPALFDPALAREPLDPRPSIKMDRP